MSVTRVVRIFLFMLCAAVALPSGAESHRVERTLRVMFWNVENLFHPDDDPDKDDDEFLPTSGRHWTYSRYFQKLQRLTQALIAAGEGEAPALVGVAEVENDSVLEHWTRHTSLRQLDYNYVMTHSPDVRGLNVALLYQRADFRLSGCESWRIPMPQGTRPTRDLLHVWGTLVGGDTLDVVICHLPSRLGGVKRSAPARNAAHRRLRCGLDSLQNVRERPRLLVMGDMNDYPNTKSLQKDLALRRPGQTIEPAALYNLMMPLQEQLKRGRRLYGSHKYEGDWDFLDHFMVSGSLLAGADDEKSTVSVRVENARSWALPDMLTDDARYFGLRPKRTYHGFRYEAGYSDHLPILLDLTLRYGVE